MLHGPHMLKLNAENYTLFVVAAKGENISKMLFFIEPKYVRSYLK